jgi:hypothetical protein
MTTSQRRKRNRLYGVIGANRQDHHLLDRCRAAGLHSLPERSLIGQTLPVRLLHLLIDVPSVWATSRGPIVGSPSGVGLVGAGQPRRRERRGCRTYRPVPFGQLALIRKATTETSNASSCTIAGVSDGRLRGIRRVPRCEISQSGRDALAWARFNLWARFNFWAIPAGSRKYGGGSCNPSMLRSYFAPA